MSYIANVLIINDPKHPEFNGQVKLFKFGKKIFDKIMDKARPTFEDEEPVNVFDYWGGANFKLRLKMSDGFPNYDSSEFEGVSAVADSDEDILAIANQQFKLAEFVDAANPKHFKSYDELKKKLENVLSGSSDPLPTASNLVDEDFEPSPRVKAAPTPGPSKAAPAPKSKTLDDSDDGEMLSYFQSIADED